MQILDWGSLSLAAKRQALGRSPLIGDLSVEQSVRDIVEQVSSQGDAALLSLNKRFDGVELTELALTAEQITAACDRVNLDVKQAIAQAVNNIEAFHRAQVFQAVDIETQAGIRCELRSEPIERVGLYIPGGTAPLISTVMMLALPARIAGCEKRILVSPPPINDAIIYAANVCGITDIFQVGGAQAIAALAFGTESIPNVDKIFGPGNRYVTEAKRLVSQDSRVSVSIDMPAGPSEVLVIADKDASPAFVAADLLSQAEHGVDSQVMLVTDSLTLAERVNQALAEQLAQLSRKEIAAKALESSRSILVKDMNEATTVSNLYAPEHLIIQTSAPRELLKQIRGAGSVFLGAYTPESAGDYASGTNHVLPTYGYSRSVSSLSLADFSRRFTVQELSPQGLQALGKTVMLLAENELLDAHKNAIALRLVRLDSLATEGLANVGSAAMTSFNPSDLARPELLSLTPYQSARRIGGQGDIWINANESPFNNSDLDKVNRYPECQPAELINAYSRYSGVKPSQIIASRGADEAIELLIRTFCVPAKDSIACFGPTYGMYAISAATFNVAVTELNLTNDYQLPDLWTTLIRQAHIGRPKIVFICNPNNPTGTVVTKDKIEQAIQAAADSIVVVDEAYIEFCPEYSVADLIERYPNLVVLRTLSKAFALAGARCGFMLANEAIIDLVMRVIAPYPVPLPVSELAVSALTPTGIDTMRTQVASLIEQGRRLSYALSAYGAKVLPAKGNYVLAQFDDVARVASLLKGAGIVARAYKHPRLSDAIRFSFTNPEQTNAIIALFDDAARTPIKQITN